ncbi:MAG: hypothetical protein EBU46_12065 [Nitrosomonadaceae bacterium]|nr:hypothetical protein [Nitrosomonadaceae bacterium]
MRNTLKNFAMGACAIILSGNFHLASADTSSDTEILLNWAENTYPAYFPTHQVTQNIDPWIFRHYPDTGIYAGVNKNDGNVYVMGRITAREAKRVASVISGVTGVKKVVLVHESITEDELANLQAKPSK